MAVTSGFFEAQFDINDNPDREYSAEQFGALFDGIISDGIFKNYKNAMEVNKDNIVVEQDEDGVNKYKVYIKTGRAWLDHTWTLNNSDYAVYLDAPEAVNNRIDLIVLRVNKTERSNRFVVINGRSYGGTGTATRPPITITDTVKDYVIAEVHINASPNITTDSIVISFEDRRGTAKKDANDNPIQFADVVVPTDMNYTTLMNNLNSNFTSQLSLWKAEFDEWFAGIQDSLGTLSNNQVVALTLLVTKVYENEYVAGKYPYFEEANLDLENAYGGNLYLSANDSSDPPSIEINYGYVSMKLSGANTSNEFIIHTEAIQENE